jgi:hypothetical protein
VTEVVESWQPAERKQTKAKIMLMRSMHAIWVRGNMTGLGRRGVAGDGGYVGGLLTAPRGSGRPRSARIGGGKVWTRDVMILICRSESVIYLS